MNDLDAYRERGYVLARSVFDEREVMEMRDAIDRILDTVAGSEYDENHTWSSERPSTARAPTAPAARAATSSSSTATPPIRPCSSTASRST
jgi:hypothetical protein